MKSQSISFAIIASVAAFLTHLATGQTPPTKYKMTTDIPPSRRFAGMCRHFE